MVGPRRHDLVAGPADRGNEVDRAAESRPVRGQDGWTGCRCRIAEPLLTPRTWWPGRVRRCTSTAAGTASINLFFGRDQDPTGGPAAEPVLRVVAADRPVARRSDTGRGTPAGLEEDDRTLFLAVAGHELRTPVTVVKGYAGMLAGPVGRAGRGWTAGPARPVLTQRADELARLVDRMLGASVGDGTAGWLVRAVPFDPLETLLPGGRDLPAELRRSVRLDAARRLPPASGDPAMLGPVVTELVTNAVRTADPGAAARPAGPPSAAWRSGRGRPADRVHPGLRPGRGHRPDLCRAGVRTVLAGPPGRGQPRAAVGLGLYLVRRLVEQTERMGIVAPARRAAEPWPRCACPGRRGGRVDCAARLQPPPGGARTGWIPHSKRAEPARPGHRLFTS